MVGFYSRDGGRGTVVVYVMVWSVRVRSMKSVEYLPYGAWVTNPPHL